MSQSIELEKRFRPFSDGSQFQDWKASNCKRCKKYNELADRPEETCELDFQLWKACMGDGSVSRDVAVRIGYLVDAVTFQQTNENYNWPCTEVDWTEEWQAEWLRRKEQAVND